MHDWIIFAIFVVGPVIALIAYSKHSPSQGGPRDGDDSVGGSWGP